MKKHIDTSNAIGSIPDRLVLEKERKHLTSISRTHAWALEQQGLFPKRRKLYPGGNINCWKLSELMRWIDSRETISSQEILS